MITDDDKLGDLFNNYILSRCGKITLVIVVGGAVVAVASSSRSTMMYTPQVDFLSPSDLGPISS